MSRLTVPESPFEMGSTEKLPLGFDFTNVLGAETIASIKSVTLKKVEDDSDYATTGLSGSATFTGSIATQTVHQLIRDNSYLITVTITTSGGKDWAAECRIDCVN